MLRRAPFIVAAVGLSVALVASAGAHSTKTAALTGKVVFSSDRSGGYEIHVMKAGGGGIARLTSAPGDDDSPAWSPDGSRIVFTSTRDHLEAGTGQGTTEVYVMKADGSGQTRLTSNASQDWGPRWSPDGKRIAFASNLTEPGNDFDIVVTSADGTGRVDLTPRAGRQFIPIWSRAGSSPSRATTTVTTTSTSWTPTARV